MPSIWDREDVRRAEQWIVSGIKSGLNIDETWQMWRGAGGEITRSLWREAWRSDQTVFVKGAEALALPDNLTPPQRLYSDSGADYSALYVAKFEVVGVSPAGERSESFYITMEDNRNRTMREFKAEAQDVMSSCREMPQYDHLEFIGLELYKPTVRWAERAAGG